MGTLIAAKQNPPVCREGVAQSSSKQSPCPPLPWGVLAEVRMEADDESKPKSGGVLSGEEPQHHAAGGGGLYPSTHHLASWMLGFRFMVSLLLVHAEEGTQLSGPGGMGGLMGCLHSTGWAVECAR